jgi:hypothetical protein
VPENDRTEVTLRPRDLKGLQTSSVIVLATALTPVPTLKLINLMVLLSLSPLKKKKDNVD